MTATKEMLTAQCDLLNRYTQRGVGNRYYVGYENGGTHLFLEVGSGRRTVCYGYTKGELLKQLNTLNNVMAIEEERSKVCG